VLVLDEDLEDPPRDAEPPLERLVGVGVRPERDRRADVRGARELFLQQPGGVGFVKIFVSKSNPGERLRNAWDGRAKQYEQPCSQPR
jgi:hypothetical protein